MLIILYYYICGHGVCLRMCVRACTYEHANVHAYVGAYTHVSTRVCVFEGAHVPVCICIGVCIYACAIIICYYYTQYIYMQRQCVRLYVGTCVRM